MPKLRLYQLICTETRQIGYLVSDLDEQDENDEYEQVVDYAQSSDDDVDDFEHKVTNRGMIVCPTL